MARTYQIAAISLPAELILAIKSRMRQKKQDNRSLYIRELVEADIKQGRKEKRK